MEVIVIALIVLGGILYVAHHQRKVREAKEIDPYLREAELFLKHTSEIKKAYISRDIYEATVSQWRQAFNFLRSANPKVRNMAGVAEFLDDYGYFEVRVDEWNDAFVRAEIDKRAAFFSNIDRKALDVQQKTAVVTDEINELVIAGAGSGKTLTIVAKVMYLVRFLGIDPRQILVLAFNRKAAAELTQRLDAAGISLEAQTFHKLGLSYITEYNKRRPDIAEEDALRRSVLSFFNQLAKKSKEQAQQVLSFLGIYSYDLKDESEYKTLGDYYEAQAGSDLETLRSKYLSSKNLKSMETLRKEKMKSIGETIIANFLFLNGIEYEYERRYPYPCDDYRKAYHPDFYLPEYDIYLEHFGVDANGDAKWLSEIEEKKYKEGIIWKRDFHRKNGTKLIESYSYWKRDGSLVARLDKLLRDNHVQYQPVDEAEIFRTIYDSKTDPALQEVCKLITSFLCLYKENGHKDFTALRRDSKWRKTRMCSKGHYCFWILLNPFSWNTKPA